jgi:hypothetical protein
MVRMTPARILRIVWAALLALAVASAWSSAGMAASPPVAHVHAHADVQADHAHHPAMTAHADARKVDAHRPAATANDLSSDPAGMTCCVMTICHPAIPVLPVQIAHVVSNGQPAPAPFLRSDGKEPSPALPPPRNSQV